jgi:hypothetical protein
MGYGKYSDTAYREFATKSAATPRHELFHRGTKDAPVRSGQEVNIEKIKYRESRDSADHPCSTPLMVGLDVTGSMGMIPEYMVKEGLGPFVGQTLQRKPITDPHLLFMAIGDATQRDEQPLQATQFESDNCIVDQLTDLYLEGGGGGNHFESYDLAWAFAAYRTRTDAWEKRQAKGYLFTIGDECFPGETSESYLRKIFGADCPQSPSPDSLLAAAQERYHVFHVIIAEGNYCRGDGLQRATASWREKLQKRALVIDNYRRTAELLVSAMAVNEGMPVGDVLDWWSQDVAGVVAKALGA